MLAHPLVLALVLASTLSAIMMALAAVFAVRLLLRWNPSSGSEMQIRLERTTYLVSTLAAFVAAVEVASLAAFAFTADRMAVLFVGAMCAVGTLNASVYGFPTLFAKIAVFLGAFAWLVLDYADNRGRDYPFVRIKYGAVLLLAPLVLTEAALQFAYFLDLRAATITSCCGKLFGDARRVAGVDLAGVEPKLAATLLFGGLLVTIGFALSATRSRLMAGVLGLLSPMMFSVAIAGVVSLVSVYVYELPHHHCPFCLLKREYGYFGFPLYGALFLATGAGLSAGVLAAVPHKPSLQTVLPILRRRLSIGAAGGFALFGALSLWAIWASRLVLGV
jgi:hypothetical protein